MKILFPLNAFYPSQIGGPCNTLYWHTSALKSNDVKCTILTTDLGIKNNNIIRNKWIENECGKIYYSKQSIISKVKSLCILTRELHRNDIIHINSLFNLYSIYSFFYVKLFLRKKNIVCSVRGQLNKNALKFSNIKKRPLLYLYKKWNKNVIYHSTSKNETKDIQHIFPFKKVIQEPNLIKTCERLELPTKKQILFLGRIHPIKGIHKLIKALAKSNYFLNSNFNCLIVGKNEKRHLYYKKELQTLVDDNKLNKKIVFKGHIEGIQKEKIYSSSYALILPSETENFGNVVIEALNQGTPVLASQGTPWSILEKYNAGFHVSNEESRLALKIDEILNLDNESYKSMRTNCKKLVDERYNVDSQIYKWIKIYNKLSP